MDSSSYITNINRVLKKIKLDTKADFIQSEQTDIIMTTNKVATQLDLQTIKQYMKSTNHIEAEKIKIS